MPGSATCPTAAASPGSSCAAAAHQADGYIAAAAAGGSGGPGRASRSPISGPPAPRRSARERVDVVTEGEYVAQGSPVRVVRSEGYRHVVRGARTDAALFLLTSRSTAVDDSMLSLGVVLALVFIAHHHRW